jgi:hypothetical protein
LAYAIVTRSDGPVPLRETNGQQNAHRCVASGRNPGRRRPR